MAWISAYGCTSAAGLSMDDFWNGLIEGRDHSRVMDQKNWPSPQITTPVPLTMKAYLQPRFSSETQKENLILSLLASWKQVQNALDSSARAELLQARLGVILASTKGFIDDVIWSASRAPVTDTISPLLEEFLKRAELKPDRTSCVSNACASSLSALFLAKNWLQQDLVDHVLILSADAVGPFVVQGFQALRVLTSEATNPFSVTRSGFYLGEASSALLLTGRQIQDSCFQVKSVAIDTEGSAVTRPSQSGSSLRRAIEKVLPTNLDREKLNCILAHGTATVVNDAVEDQVFYELFFQHQMKPLTTGTKWSVGHTLAVSGALDLIAGCQMLKTQKSFPIASTKVIDPKFRCDYLIAGKQPVQRSLQNFLVTSLGFGGIHGAAYIEKAS